MTIKGGTNKACAACKYQRRKCSKDCPLAPYFPADDPKMFQNAHRLFGVSNIQKILKEVPPHQREETMKSIKYESNMRARFPVNGCLGIILTYNYQLQRTVEEMHSVKTWLAICKEQCQYPIPPPTPPPHDHQSSPNPHNISASSHLQSGLTTTDDVLPVYHHHHHQYPQLNNEFLVSNNNNNDNNTNNEVYNGICFEAGDDQNQMAKQALMSSVQHTTNNYYGTFGNSSVNPMALPGLGLQPAEMDQLCPVYDDNDIPFDAIADDRQSHIESKEPCESSAESSFKDTNTAQHMENIAYRNELKNAAARFSLTSVNDDQDKLRDPIAI